MGIERKNVKLFILWCVVALCLYYGLQFFWPAPPLEQHETTTHPYVELLVKDRDNKRLGHVASVFVKDDKVYAIRVLSRGWWLKGIRTVGEGKFVKRSVGQINLTLTYDQFRALPSTKR